MGDWLAKVKVEEGTLILRSDWTWEASDPYDDLLAAQAELADAMNGYPFYEYSPADGAPGAALAHLVADKLGGKVELPRDLGRANLPGVVY
jgi:hypothetical protein